MPEDGHYWPKHVARSGETNTICCGWQYIFINF